METVNCLQKNCVQVEEGVAKSLTKNATEPLARWHDLKMISRLSTKQVEGVLGQRHRVH